MDRKKIIYEKYINEKTEISGKIRPTSAKQYKRNVNVKKKNNNPKTEKTICMAKNKHSHAYVCAYKHTR